MGPGVCLAQFLGSGIAGTERTCDFNFDAVHRGLLPEKDTSSPQPHRVRPLRVFPTLVGDMVSQYLIMSEAEHLSTCLRHLDSLFCELFASFAHFCVGLLAFCFLNYLELLKYLGG